MNGTIKFESVYMCPSSVLDRLNPLLENHIEREIVLSECGTIDGKTRVVRAHTDFRLILGMSQEAGGPVQRK